MFIHLLNNLHSSLTLEWVLSHTNKSQSWRVSLTEQIKSAFAKTKSVIWKSQDNMTKYYNVKHSSCFKKIFKWVMLWNALDTDNFSFLLFNFSDFILILFSFLWLSFGQWRGMWHCSHMTCHMMWHHRPQTW